MDARVWVRAGLLVVWNDGRSSQEQQELRNYILQHTQFAQDSFCNFRRLSPATGLNPFTKKLQAYKSNRVYRPVREDAARNGVQIPGEPPP
jgi:hypothetical protein